MMAGFIIGFCAWFFMSAVANFFKMNEGKDIMTVASQAKARFSKPVPKAKPKPKKRVRK